MTITKSGNVGIGTLSPGAAKLHILASNNIHGLRITGNSGNSAQIYATGSNYGIRVATTGSSGAYYSAFFEGSTGKGLWVGDNGNIGINTTNTIQNVCALTVVGQTVSPTTSTMSLSSSQAIARFSGAQGQLLEIGAESGNYWDMWVQTHNGGTGSSNSRNLCLQPIEGKVGIGTMSPKERLDVGNGKICLVDVG